ncbi:hypothetical protein H8356DRAFT_1323642 [Neocallimastix lanati (nom. inval.)]|nr:hypothetical protein H8356DRAFT_1323642 [Neocallimastix sp. JGI-2020a]
MKNLGKHIFVEKLHGDDQNAKGSQRGQKLLRNFDVFYQLTKRWLSISYRNDIESSAIEDTNPGNSIKQIKFTAPNKHDKEMEYTCLKRNNYCSKYGYCAYCDSRCHSRYRKCW